MKTSYIAPLTEIVYVNAQAILQSGLDQDSTGTVPGDSPEILTNEGTFDEETSSKSLWDD